MVEGWVGCGLAAAFFKDSGGFGNFEHPVRRRLSPRIAAASIVAVDALRNALLTALLKAMPYRVVVIMKAPDGLSQMSYSGEESSTRKTLQLLAEKFELRIRVSLWRHRKSCSTQALG
jgi:hypothetical protein